DRESLVQPREQLPIAVENSEAVADLVTANRLADRRDVVELLLVHGHQAGETRRERRVAFARREPLEGLAHRADVDDGVIEAGVAQDLLSEAALVHQDPPSAQVLEP